MFILERLNKEKKAVFDAVLSRLRARNDESAARIEALEAEIARVKEAEREASAADMQELKTLTHAAVLELFGVKEGDVVEVRRGWRSKQVRTCRINEIFAEPDFFDFDDAQATVVRVSIRATVLRKDGQQGETKWIDPQDIKKVSK